MILVRVATRQEIEELNTELPGSRHHLGHVRRRLLRQRSFQLLLTLGTEERLAVRLCQVEPAGSVGTRFERVGRARGMYAVESLYVRAWG